MLFLNSKFTLLFGKIENIKKIYINDIEQSEILSGYNEATILPIPDNAPVEIPRILIDSLDDNAHIAISNCSITLIVDYSEYDLWEQCAEELVGKIQEVAKLYSKLDCKYEYCGLVTEVICKEKESDGTSVIVDNALKIKVPKKDLYGAGWKVTLKKDDDYFINITTENIRYTEDNEKRNGIKVIIDINDKVAREQNIYEENHINTIIRYTKNIVTNMDDIIYKGEVIV